MPFTASGLIYFNKINNENEKRIFKAIYPYMATEEDNIYLKNCEEDIYY